MCFTVVKIMKTTVYAILVLMCCACQTGRIPCPDARGPRIHKVKVKNNKRFLEYTASVSSQREQSDKSITTARENDQRFVRNVSQDEWDCPKPGEKKYMPKSVKDNIRKNMKRIRSADKQQKSDSLHTR
jgi:hypothetical protein